MTMFGAIIGDIVGSVYEFRNIKTTEFPLFSPRSNFTDDTLMTLAVAQWLLTDPRHSQEELVRVMQNMARTYRLPMGGYGRYFRRWLASNSPEPYRSYGNGSAMRVSPVGLYANSLDEAIRLAAVTAEVTHNHPEGVKGAMAVAACIFLARAGFSRDVIRLYVENTFGYSLHRTCDEIRPNYRFDSSCPGSVPEAITAFLESSSFEDAIRLAVSLGGDSDTIACITGSIAASFYGVPDEISAQARRRFAHEPDLLAIVDRFDALYPARRPVAELPERDILDYHSC